MPSLYIQIINFNSIMLGGSKAFSRFFSSSFVFFLVFYFCLELAFFGPRTSFVREYKHMHMTSRNKSAEAKVSLDWQKKHKVKQNRTQKSNNNHSDNNNANKKRPYVFARAEGLKNTITANGTLYSPFFMNVYTLFNNGWNTGRGKQQQRNAMCECILDERHLEKNGRKEGG